MKHLTEVGLIKFFPLLFVEVLTDS